MSELSAPARTRSLRLVVLYVILVLCWGTTFLWVGIATPDTSPLVLADGRLLVGLLTVVCVTLLLGPRFRAAHSPAQLRPWLLLGLAMSLLSAAIPFVLLALAQRHISGGTASILNSAAPLWTAILVFAGAGAASERLAPGAWLGLALGVLGVGVLVGGTPAGSLAGCLLMFGVVVSYSSGGVVAARAFGRAPPHTAAFMTTGWSAVLLLPFAVLGWLADPPDLGAAAAIVALGATSTGMAYVVYYELIRSIGVTRTLTVTYLQPLLAIGLGVQFLDESLRAWHLVGLVCILAGVAIVNGQLPAGLTRWASRR